jgi:hypothetical protein
MRNLLAFAVLFSTQAFAQSNSLSYYYNFPMEKAPKGIKATFEADVVIPAGQGKVRLGVLHSGKECYLILGEDKVQQVDQMIPSGTIQKVASADENIFYLNKDHDVCIECYGDEIKIGDMAMALKNVVMFEFPVPKKAKPFKF